MALFKAQVQYKKIARGLVLPLVVAGLAVLPWVAGAQAPAPSSATFGTLTIDFAKYYGNNEHIRFWSGVHIKSLNYELQAQTMDVYLARKAAKTPGVGSLAKVTAEGDPAKGTQVFGQFENIEQAEKIKLYGDHAVYTPDSSRVNGGTVHFTGHVRMLILDAQALAEPSTTTADQVTVLLGQGPDYPQVEGDSGHMVLTPLQ